MELMINMLALLASIVCGVCLLVYIPRLYSWFFASIPQQKLKNSKKNKLAIIIPARNESAVVGSLIDSIKKQTYDNFDFFTIVKNPNDPTIKMSEQEGGYCYVVEGQTCKGDALDFCLKTILKERAGEYDAFIIVDADCTLDEMFLEQMNNALASGRQIVQAKKIVKNYGMQSKVPMSACCNGIIWTIIDELGNRFKSARGITNMTIGTGIMLRSDVVQLLGGWPYRQTLTEDIELMYDCVVRNFSTFYYSYAMIYVEEADNLKDTNKRRNRWLNGVVNSKRCYKKALRALPKTKRNLINIYYTTALEPVYVYIGTLAIYGTLSLLAAGILAAFSNALWLKSLVFGCVSWGLIYVSFFIMTAFCVAVDNKHIKLSFKRKIVLLLIHPIFYMGYIGIIGRALLTRGNWEWKTINRVDFNK